MTPAQLRAALARLGLTQVGAARILRANPRSMRKWLAGDRPICDRAAILVTLMCDGKVTPKDIDKAYAK